MHKNIHKNILAASALVAFTLSGCANMTETQKDTAKGAGIGAAGGAVVGAVPAGVGRVVESISTWRRRCGLQWNSK